MPAAGRARRLGALPCSKEILPVAFAAAGENGPPRMRAACEHLLDAYRDAGIARALVLLRRGKGDVVDYLGSGERWGVELLYRALDEPTANVPATLSHGLPLLDDSWVALGFPDILFTPRDAYAHLLHHRRENPGAEVVLGLFPTRQFEKTDMVELDERGRARRLVIKEGDAGLRDTWSIALWSPAFSTFLAEYLATEPEPPSGPEIYVGDVIQAAIDSGMRVDGVRFPEGSFLDVGTPDDLRRALLSG